jgi:hypothetical protein
LEALIAEHQEKIRLESKKELVDQALINHWQKEIRAFEKGIQQALRYWYRVIKARKSYGVRV